ncbi:hypothetical protein Ahy_B04g068955 isoform A [Arachis hypogaea]|uniref:Uncharacterized protein n=1 Tax=Arachis hypogaea TaxID=3818 RepID=A0A444ZB71_ARAHY|nr:hypothetical protein Ahy_B04g068955 isoform A [Arachis hypogaea]
MLKKEKKNPGSEVTYPHPHSNSLSLSQAAHHPSSEATHPSPISLSLSLSQFTVTTARSPPDARVSPRLPPSVSARAVRVCCCSSSVVVAACTAAPVVVSARFCLSVSLESRLSHIAGISSFVCRVAGVSTSRGLPWAPLRRRQKQLVGLSLASSPSLGSSLLVVFCFRILAVAESPWTVERCSNSTILSHGSSSPTVAAKAFVLKSPFSATTSTTYMLSLIRFNFTTLSINPCARMVGEFFYRFP